MAFTDNFGAPKRERDVAEAIAKTIPQYPGWSGLSASDQAIMLSAARAVLGLVAEERRASIEAFAGITQALNAESERLSAAMVDIGNKFSEYVAKVQLAYDKADELPNHSDAVVLVTNDDGPTKQKWLAWRAHDGSWDVTDGRGDHSQMTSIELTGLGSWVELSGKQD